MFFVLLHSGCDKLLQTVRTCLDSHQMCATAAALQQQRFINHCMSAPTLGLRETTGQPGKALRSWNFDTSYGRFFLWWFCSVRSLEAPAWLKQCIEVILSIELKQNYCEILESVPAVFAKLSWNFYHSLSSCSALAGNREYITSLSIYFRDIFAQR